MHSKVSHGLKYMFVNDLQILYKVIRNQLQILGEINIWFKIRYNQEWSKFE